MKLVHDMAQNNNLPNDFDFLTKVLFHTLIACVMFRNYRANAGRTVEATVPTYPSVGHVLFVRWRQL